MILDTWYPSPDDLPLSQVAIRMPPRGTDKYVENCGNMKYIMRDYNPETKIPDDIAKEEGFRTVGQYITFLKTMTGEHDQSINYFYMAYMEGFVSVDFEQRFTKADHWMLQFPKTREFSRLYLLHNSIDVIAPYYAHYLLDGIAHQLQNAAEGKSKFRLSLFSFHDLNLLSVLRAFGIRNKPTEFLAIMAFELWKHSENLYVKLRMSEGLSTNWVYRPDEYVPLLGFDGGHIEEFSEVRRVMLNFYKNQINITNCGYFGPDAKV
ncbi:hypothetical protein BIW11_07981 [Tropilaelaps mercedesae]|uniref:Lysosomal acid phosphatase-like n=1 Tax=Tropilaelaps mercedesae TaxID=418985 RepID=A0A1V9XRR5_9ACAR|nr:hypothetical protein BIW11_07981 [Tropilaelaps mercedesae]